VPREPEVERRHSRDVAGAATVQPAVLLAPSPPAPAGAHRPAQPSQPAPRIYSHAELEFGYTPGRDECWQQLSEPVRERLMETAGPCLDWWAVQYEPCQTWAVVLGTRALVIATPTLHVAGQPTHALWPIGLRLGSLQATNIHQSPRGRSLSSSHRGSGPYHSEPTQDLHLHPIMATFLGVLPPQAQAFLQIPFLGERENLQWCRRQANTAHGTATES